MSGCDHKTDEEYRICNRCSAFERIARAARGLMSIRKIYMANLLIPGTDNDAIQEALNEASKNLEQSIQFADNAKLWGD